MASWSGLVARSRRSRSVGSRIAGPAPGIPKPTSGESSLNARSSRSRAGSRCAPATKCSTPPELTRCTVDQSATDGTEIRARSRSVTS